MPVIGDLALFDVSCQAVGRRHLIPVRVDVFQQIQLRPGIQRGYDRRSARPPGDLRPPAAVVRRNHDLTAAFVKIGAFVIMVLMGHFCPDAVRVSGHPLLIIDSRRFAGSFPEIRLCGRLVNICIIADACRRNGFFRHRKPYNRFPDQILPFSPWIQRMVQAEGIFTAGDHADLSRGRRQNGSAVACEISFSRRIYTDHRKRSLLSISSWLHPLPVTLLLPHARTGKGPVLFCVRISLLSALYTS